LRGVILIELCIKEEAGSCGRVSNGILLKTFLLIKRDFAQDILAQGCSLVK